MQTSYIHDVLKRWDKTENWPYMSSILILNKDVPLFEDWQLDYEWLLRATKNRHCVEVDPCVIRWVEETNLSLNEEYRRRDYYGVMTIVDGDVSAMRRVTGSRARYHYKRGNMKIARFHFLQAQRDWKTVLYFISSYLPKLSKWIVRKYGVSG